jgi:hypothetical protein
METPLDLGHGPLVVPEGIVAVKSDQFDDRGCRTGHGHEAICNGVPSQPDFVIHTGGKVTFHSCAATAYPLPHPGQAPAPNPVVLPARRLPGAVGIRSVNYQSHGHDVAIKDESLT